MKKYKLVLITPCDCFVLSKMCPKDLIFIKYEMSLWSHRKCVFI